MHFGKTPYHKFFRGLIFLCYLGFFANQFNPGYFSLSNYYDYGNAKPELQKQAHAAAVAGHAVSPVVHQKAFSHVLHLSLDKRFEHQHLYCRTDQPYYLRTVRYALLKTQAYQYSEDPVTALHFHFDFRGPPSL